MIPTKRSEVAKYLMTKRTMKRAAVSAFSMNFAAALVFVSKSSMSARPGSVVSLLLMGPLETAVGAPDVAKG